MNKIINNVITKKSPFSRGSIWKSEQSGELFILSEVIFGYFTAIGLTNGNRWKEKPYSDKKNAVEGLTFVAESVTIEISDKDYTNK
jgi:hypothetical protein